MTRDQIIAEIKRTAAANGGVPLGRERFQSETGIRQSEWYGVHWAKWGDALREAGFVPNEWNSAIPDAELLQLLSPFVKEIGHVPTVGELRLRSRSDPCFPSHNTFRRWGGKREMIAALQAYAVAHDDPHLASLCVDADTAKAEAHTSDDRSVHLDEADAFVYLMKSGKYYKIGRTNAPGRRERELALQLPEKATVVHEIRTDDPVGIERYWHQRFSERRLNGEWFDLSADDVRAFRRRKFM